MLLTHDAAGWTFRYADGLRCEVTWNPPVVQLNQDVRQAPFLLRIAGPLTAMLMDLAGYYPLHACGVAVGSGIVAVHGASGAGKSSLAAVLAATGVPVAGDDLLPLDPSGTIAGIAGSLRVDAALAPPGWVPVAILPDTRSWYRLPPLPALPLNGLLLLQRGDRPALEPVRGADRLAALLRAGYLSHLEPAPAPAWHQRIFELAGRIPVYRLQIPPTLRALLEQRDLLRSLLETVTR